MGAKDSKRSCLIYEDAVKRMSEAEFKRVCEAFKRLTNGNQLLSRQSFTQNVLGDGVPPMIADWLYTACGGGGRGIALRDLICGLVLLTKGTQEEKIKFLWTLYSNDAGTHITKAEFQSSLQTEGALPSTLSNPNLWWDRTIISLFGVGQDRVTFEHFRAWIQYNKEATVLSKWLLTNSSVSLSSELETPTFYQTLAGVTHLEEEDICELEKCFWSLSAVSPCRQLDLACISCLASPPVPTSACLGLFLALDVNGDGHVDFKELCCGISAACRGPTAERIKFCFKIFDLDQDGYLNMKELQNMVDILTFVAKEHSPKPHQINLIEKSPKAPLATHDCDDNCEDFYWKVIDNLKKRLTADGSLSQEDFLIWGIDDNNLITPLLQLLFEVCHVSLGLKPLCRHHEYEIVMGWLTREELRGYRVGQFWYLISTEWWQSWISYTTASRTSYDQCACRLEQRLPIEEGIVCDESFTSNSTDYISSHSNEFTSNSTDSMGDLLSKGDTCSIASSSGVSSSSSSGSKRNQGGPGPIDNTCLVTESFLKVATLTGEGGRLKRDRPLVQHRDFILVPDSLWKALALWYGGPLPLPRQVIRPTASIEVELELYPLNLGILRHQTPTGNSSGTWTSVVGGYGAAALNTAGITSPVGSPRRYLAHTAAFSRLANVRQVIEFLSLRLGLRIEDVRLWHVRDNTILLEDEVATLQDLGIQDGDQLLLEVRNKDLTWPEELGALVSGVTNNQGLISMDRRPTICLPPGATGLHNLGNTCFMNAALQAVSNTRPLTQYFQRDMQLCELNSTNPLGTRGQVARRYAELCRELWTGSTRSVAPLKLRWCVTKHAPHLGGGGQHDSQELLAWLLDALHEDLNRVARKQYTELRDSDGRPDMIVAEEAWQQHLARDHSIITDLFYGQLKSKVTCQTCGHESVRFDAFNLLSLPLPMESFILCEVIVIYLSGETPIKYGLRLNSEAKYSELKSQLHDLCNIPPSQLLLAEVSHSQIQDVLADDAKINISTATELYAYELPSGELPVAFNRLCAGDDDDNVQSMLARSPETSNNDSNVPEFHVKRPSLPIATTVQSKVPTYLIALHRKCVRQETYFLSQHKSKPILFGIPLLLGCGSLSTCQSLYEAVWGQVTRLLSPLPQSDQTNHATDCDDSLGYEFPFTLKAVMQGGQLCALCHWSQFCRGCTLPCSEDLLFKVCQPGPIPMWIAIDWDPTALHLRYQSSREKIFLEHETISTCRKQHTEPIDLDYCLKAFTSEERLEAKYHCSKCQDKQPATKKLQIWRLPPILIVHLKRFDYVNNKWVKTQKVVNFPFKDFDPTGYLASVPQETILRHKQLEQKAETSGVIEENDEHLHGGGEDSSMCNERSRLVAHESGAKSSKDKARERLVSTSLQRSPVVDEDLHDFHEHKLLDGQNRFDLKYQLYAVVSHSGLLNGGHYISYACNPNGHWYCYNDSSCREVPTDSSTEPPPPVETNNNNNEYKYCSKSANVTPLITRKTFNVSESDNISLSGSEVEMQVDETEPPTVKCAYSKTRAPKIETSNAYILFYERSGLDYKPYLPEIAGNGESLPEVELEESESELRKQLCLIQ
ncbi:ubiquitin carboxyl-terminal hydrolase 32-like isoform X2 [Photinus pyralis]|nr:ubiquitin carboxyl-terminal hydrolase 32-like isoform X2 [Photinus pyralis]